MSTLKYVLIVGLLLLFMTGYSQGQILITENFDNINLSKALKQLSKEHDLQMAFNAKFFKKEKITFNFINVEVQKALSEMVSSIGYKVILVNEVFVFFPEVSANQKPEQFDFVWTSDIQDLESHESLPYAIITIEETNEVAFSDVNGNFTLYNVPSDTSTLIIDYTGYARTRVRLTPNMVKEKSPIFIAKVSFKIPQADIRVYNNQPISHTQTIQELDPSLVNHLTTIGEQDLFNIIQMGSSVDATNERSGSLQIRGGASDENLILMDGFTLYHIDHFYQLYSSLNSSAIKNVRIHKGWYEPKFGGRSSGIIEIQGKDGNLLTTNTEIGANFNSFNVFFESPLEYEKSSIVIAARRSVSDLFTTSLYQTIFNNIYNSSSPNLNIGNAFDSTNNPQFNYYDLNLKLRFELSETTKVNFSFFNSDDKLFIEQSNNVPELGFNLDYQDKSNWKNSGHSGRWIQEWSERWVSNATIGYSTYSSKILSEDVKNDIWFNEVDTLRSDQATLLTDFSIRINNELTFKKHALSFGVQHTVNHINFKSIDSENVETSTQSGYLTSVYLQDLYKINKFSMLVGSRFNYYNVLNKIYPAPRIKLSYQLQDSLNIQLYYGENFQVIRNTQRQSLFLGTTDIWTLANTNLPINSSVQYGFEVSKIFSFFEVNISGYHREIDGSIYNLATSPLEFNTEDLFSIGRKTVDGLDIQLVKSYRHHRGWASVSFMQIVHSDHSIIPYEFYDDNDQLIQGKIAYIYSKNKWNIGGVFVYGSGKPYSPANNLYDLSLLNEESRRIISYDLLNSKRLKAYQRLDLSVTRSFNFNRKVEDGTSGEFGLSFFNITNNENIRDVKYFAVGRNNDDYELVEKEIRMLGFLPGIKLKLIF